MTEATAVTRYLSPIFHCRHLPLAQDGRGSRAQPPSWLVGGSGG